MFLGFRWKNDGNNLWVDEFFKFGICSIPKKKERKLDLFVFNVKAHGIHRFSHFFVFLKEQVSGLMIWQHLKPLILNERLGFKEIYLVEYPRNSRRS